MRFGVKLAILFVIIGLVPLAILGLFVYQQSEKTLISEKRADLASLSLFKEDELRIWMAGNVALLESVAARPQVAELAAELVATPRSTEQWTAVRDRLVGDHLTRHTSAGAIEDLILLHPTTGQVLAATHHELEGKFRESERFFLEGRETTTIGRVEYNIAEERLVMHISAPIRSDDGTLAAVLAAHLDLAEMGRIVRLSTDARRTEDVYIINDISFFVTEPRFGEEYVLRRAVSTEGAEAALRGESGVAEYNDYRGVKVIGAYRWIEELGLGLLAEIDWTEVTEPIRAFGLAVLVLGAIVGIVVLIVAYVFARGAVRPIERLIEGTTKIGQGRLDVRVDIRGHDEIAQLGNAFNRMTADLRRVIASRDDLDREVKARKAAEIRLNETIRALESSEAKFRLLTDSSPVGVFIFSDMKLRYTNPAFETIFGYARSDLLDRIGPMELTDPAQHEEAAEYIAQCFAAVPDLPPLSFRGVRKDGSVIHCEAMARPIEYEGKMALLGTIVDTTARRQAQAELHLKDTVFESSVAANSIADADGIIRHANASFLRLWGFDSKEEVVRRSIADFLAHEEEAAEIVTTLNETGEWEGDFIGLRQDGSTFISSGHATLIRDEAGGMIGYQLTSLDVTRQREIEAEARRAREITDSIIESLPGVFYQFDADGQFVRWNRAFTGVTGYSDSDMAALHPLELFAGADAERVGAKIARTFAEGYASVTAHLVTKSGQRVPYYFTGTRMLIEGTPYLIGMGTDISPLRRAEDAVRESEAKFRALVETTSDWIWEVDRNLVYTYSSPQIRSLLGYEPEEIVGMTPFDLMPEGEAEPMRQRAAELIEARGAFSEDVNVCLAKDGRAVVLESSGTPILGERGELLGYRGIDRDVTERHEAQKKLRQLLTDVQRSNTELEQFAYVASHDLQEPLRMVASYTQLLERRYKDALDADARDFIHYAVDGATRMQRLINDLLSFSRVQTRGKPFERVDLNTVLGHARSNLAAAIDETAAIVTNDELPIVWADEGQMISVFQNLIANAVKFRGESTPNVHVGVCEAADTWEITVEDNGIGISPEFHDRIFVIFQRLHGREEFEGTGIGLALCKRIVERHGGTIGVESVPGEGATLRFTLPKRPSKEG